MATFAMASQTHGRKAPGFLGPYHLSRCKQKAVSASSAGPGVSSISSVKLRSTTETVLLELLEKATT